MIEKGGCKVCDVMDPMKQTVMKSLFTHQVGDRVDLDEAIVEAEVVTDDAAEIGAEVLDEKGHQKRYRSHA